MPGRIRSLTLHYYKEFAVTTVTSLLTYQIKEGRKWVNVCTMNADTAAKVTAHMEKRGRKVNKHYRTVVLRPATK